MGKHSDVGRGASGEPADDVRAQVTEIYAGYAADPGKQRAWAADNPGNQAIRAELVGALTPLLPEDGVLLDAGCGTGWWLAALIAAGVPPERLAGVELQHERVEAATRRIPGAHVVGADVRDLPFGDGSVAFVSLLTVLSSIKSDTARISALHECRRVLRPGGVVAVWEPRVPTANRATAAVPVSLISEVFGRVDHRSLTLLPPLARRLGRLAVLYPQLVRIPVLRTHRLMICRT